MNTKGCHYWPDKGLRSIPRWQFGDGAPAKGNYGRLASTGIILNEKNYAPFGSRLLKLMGCLLLREGVLGSGAVPERLRPAKTGWLSSIDCEGPGVIVMLVSIAGVVVIWSDG